MGFVPFEPGGLFIGLKSIPGCAGISKGRLISLVYSRIKARKGLRTFAETQSTKDAYAQV